MGLTVRDVMTQRVVTARQTTPFRELLTLLREHHISALPVIDTADRVVGVVSDSDLYLKQVEPLRHRWPPLLGRRHRRVEQAKALGETAAQLMSAPAVTVQPDRSLADAATRMYRHEVKRLPVVDDNGRLVGIVTRGDLLRAYLRTDQEIRQVIERRVVPEVIERKVETVDVDLHDGTVELRGWLTRRSQALALAALVCAVDGVVAVHNNVKYEVDDTSDWSIHDPAA